LNSGNVKCVLLVQVSDIFVVNGVDCFSFRIFVHEVDPWPVGSSLGILARFVLFDPFSAFFLLMSLNFAEVAKLAVPVHVVSSA